MTTREKGTGLGLAIVTRIMEEHGGRLMLSDAPASFHDGRGACVSLEFPARNGDADAVVDQGGENQSENTYSAESSS